MRERICGAEKLEINFVTLSVENVEKQFAWTA